MCQPGILRWKMAREINLRVRKGKKKKSEELISSVCTLAVQMHFLPRPPSFCREIKWLFQKGFAALFLWLPLQYPSTLGSELQWEPSAELTYSLLPFILHYTHTQKTQFQYEMSNL